MARRLIPSGQIVRAFLVESLRTRTSRVAFALMGLVALTLCFVPGFDVLNYYSSLALALVGGLLSGLSALSLSYEREGRSLASLFGRAAAMSLLMALLGAVVLLLNAFRVTNCDIGAGLAFYGLGPVFTMLFASQWGVAAAFIGSRRRHGLAAFLALWFGWIGLDVVAFLTEPPIFSYNAFAGFFSGAVYDDLIHIDSKLLLFRLGNVFQLWLLWAFYVAATDKMGSRLRVDRLRKAGRREWGLVAGGFVAVGLMAGSAGYLGIEVDRGVIESTLGGRVEGDRIVVFYDHRKIKAQEARKILEDHTFRLHQLESFFGDEYPGTIRSYVYGSKAQKRRLMGAERTYIAKPWLGEIHLHKTPYGAGVLHHELAHVYLSQYTQSWLGVPTRGGFLPKMMLVEGSAMAVEFYGGSMTQHEWSAAMQRTGLAPDLEALMNPTSFWSVNPGSGYVSAGSFIRWILDTHGVERFKILYADGDFSQAYGSSLGTLLASWRTFLEGLELPPDAEDRARTRFGRPGMLSRVCPLVIPRLEAEVGRLRRAKRYDEALAVQEEVVGFAKEDPYKRLPLLDLHMRLKQSDQAEKAREELSRLEKATGVMLSVADEILADGLWRRGKLPEALKGYGVLLEGPLSEGRRRTLWAKILVGMDADLEPIFGPYLLGPAEADDQRYLLDAVIDHPDHRMSLYLAGRRYVAEGHYKAGVGLLEGALEAAPLASEEADALFVRETWRLLGHAYVQLGALGDAKTAFGEVLERSKNQATRATARDWLQRVDWLSKAKEAAKK